MVPANTFIDLDLAALSRQAGDGFEQGSLRVTYYGHELEMGAQVLISDLERGLQFDEQLSYATGSKSKRREAIWWTPSERTRVVLVVTNISDEVITVRGQLRAGDDRRNDVELLTTVRLAPHELRALELGSSRAGRRGSGTRSLSIEYEGPSDALMARGFVQDERSGYSTPLLFTDPAVSKTMAYHGGGVRLDPVRGRDVEPVVLARNLGDVATNLGGRLVISTSDGQIADVAVPTTRLAPHETARIDMTEVWAQANAIRGRTGAGFEFEYSSAPGSVIMSASVVSYDRQDVFRIPLIDPETIRSSTGGYMWRADGTTFTTVYLKNITNETQKYLLQLSYTGGAYAPGLRTLEPGETAVIDLRHIRDAQIPDAMGRTIPREVTAGQVHWSAKGRERYAIIGRAEHTDEVHGVSASYACMNCCPDNLYESWTVDNPVVAPIGGPVDVFLTMRDVDCYETVLEPYSVGPWYDVNWYLDNTNIATGDVNATITGVSEGSTYLHARLTTEEWYNAPTETGWTCESDPVNVYFDPPVLVTCPVPTNFRQVNDVLVDNLTPKLVFDYDWDSNTGNLAHLSSCEMRESLFRPFEYNPFPSPPFASGDFQANPNHISLPTPATEGRVSDVHDTMIPFVEPYSAISVITSQSYQYRCPCANFNNWTTLYQPFGGINREFSQNPGGSWRFSISKSGSTATKSPL
jgi:hypothetical protein